jgi:hypothetical protein
LCCTGVQRCDTLLIVHMMAVEQLELIGRH